MNSTKRHTHTEIRQVLWATEIVALVRECTPLDLVAGGDWIGTCPFCSRSTLLVTWSRQRFLCVGCRAAGNAIQFVAQRDGVPFSEALERLAKRAGIGNETLKGTL